MQHFKTRGVSGLSAGTGRLCIFGHLGLVFIWSCFVPCLLLPLYYVICAPNILRYSQKEAEFHWGNTIQQMQSSFVKAPSRDWKTSIVKIGPQCVLVWDFSQIEVDG